MIKAVIFDFDGVILETVDIKLNAFLKIFKDEPEAIQQKIAQYHLENGGLSRYEKFRVIYRDFLKRPILEEEVEQLAQTFSQYCYDEVLQAPFVLGVKKFLDQFYQEYLFFVASGTPQEEMQRIVNERGLQKYFHGVYGSPRKKEVICQQILTDHQLRSNEVIFIGDSKNDWEAAFYHKMAFIARRRADNQDFFIQKEVAGCVDHFDGFEGIFKTIEERLS